MVDDIVPLAGQVMLQLGGELEAGVVGRDVDAHAPQSRERGHAEARSGRSVQQRYDGFIMSITLGQRPLYEVKAGLFKGLSHPLRIRILELLSTATERSVAELQSETGLEASHLSQHLAVLRRNRLVESDRRGSTSTTGSPTRRSPSCSRSPAVCSLRVVTADGERVADAASLPALGPSA